MNIGFLGLGKLGLPVSLAVESKGHNVFGYDISEQTLNDIKDRKIKYREEWVDKYLPNTRLEINSVEKLVKNSEIIFVPIQTPHDPKYEGINRIPDKRIDFDYSYLKSGIKELSGAIERNGEDKVVIIISTVLPGTIRTQIKPLLGNHTKLCYNPFFIAMGSTIRDFLYPEFILFGVDDEQAAIKAQNFYKTVCNSPFYKTTIENAELIKVSYNTMISTKISFVNTIMEACHKLPNTNVDDVTNALMLGANTGFLGGPAVLANMAVDKWVPGQFANLSSRMVKQNGIIAMAIVAIFIMLITRGHVAFLVVLYSTTVFLTFSLSLFGLVRYWIKSRREHAVMRWLGKLTVATLGLIICLLILGVIVAEKFFAGGWLTLVVMGLMIAGFLYVHNHYLRFAKKIEHVDHLLTKKELKIQYLIIL